MKTLTASLPFVTKIHRSWLNPHHKKPVMMFFDVFVNALLENLINKQSRRQQFAPPPPPPPSTFIKHHHSNGGTYMRFIRVIVRGSKFLPFSGCTAIHMYLVIWMQCYVRWRIHYSTLTERWQGAVISNRKETCCLPLTRPVFESKRLRNSLSSRLISCSWTD